MPASDRTTHAPREASRARGNRERGATVVELALVLPVFFVLVFGLIEFSYLFAQNNEVRFIAREGARAASVGDSASAAICDNMTLLDDAGYAFGGGGAIADDGSVGQVTVTAPYQTLTGLFDGMLGGITLESTHAFFAEADVSIPGGGSC